MTQQPHIRRDLSQRAHRLLIGFLGLFLPGLLFFAAGVRPTEGLQPWRFLHSVSAYYYTGAVGAFVGVLFALSLFLFSYRGYTNDKADRMLGKLGGVAALGVALFPTAPPPGLSGPKWWNPATGMVHYASAVLLFFAFILFSMWLFRKSSEPSRQNRPAEKRVRDRICLACGIVMVICVLWAGSSMLTGARIFWPEALAIVAFATSWLVKGEVHRTVKGLALRLVNPFLRGGRISQKI